MKEIKNKELQKLINKLNTMDNLDDALSLESLIDIAKHQTEMFSETVNRIETIGMNVISTFEKTELLKKINSVFNLNSDEMYHSDEYKKFKVLITG